MLWEITDNPQSFSTPISQLNRYSRISRPLTHPTGHNWPETIRSARYTRHSTNPRPGIPISLY